MKKSGINTNKFFALFFAMYFTLYQYKYAQIALFAMLGLYVLNSYYKKKKNAPKDKSNKKNIFLFGWFGLFVIFSCVSKLWAIGTLSESRTITTLIRMLFVGVMIFMYCTSKEEVLSVIKAYVFGVFIMCIVVVILTPPAYYGNEYYFGKIIGQHRNSIGAAIAESILYMYFFREKKAFKFKKILTIFFIFMLVISGSRGAIIELLVFLDLYFILNIRYKRIYKYCIVLITMGIIVYLLVINIPYLYNTIYMRFVNMFDTLTGSTVTDGSTYSRSLMKKVAIELFKTKPILGSGIDGYEVYLSYNPRNFGHVFRGVYSHCNYTEIAANYGSVGLFIWYFPLVCVLKRTFCNMKNNRTLKYLFCTLIAIIFSDFCRIPWGVDVSIFSYFIVLMSIIFYNNYEETEVLE